jgi:hypothetical protein
MNQRNKIDFKSSMNSEYIDIYVCIIVTSGPVGTAKAVGSFIREEMSKIVKDVKVTL